MRKTPRPKECFGSPTSVSVAVQSLLIATCLAAGFADPARAAPAQASAGQAKTTIHILVRILPRVRIERAGGERGQSGIAVRSNSEQLRLSVRDLPRSSAADPRQMLVVPD